MMLLFLWKLCINGYKTFYQCISVLKINPTLISIQLWKGNSYFNCYFSSATENNFSSNFSFSSYVSVHKVQLQTPSIWHQRSTVNRICIIIQYMDCVQTRDVVLEASALARGSLEASFFLAGSASPRPHTVLPRSRPYCLGSAS